MVGSPWLSVVSTEWQQLCGVQAGIRGGCRILLFAKQGARHRTDVALLWRNAQGRRLYLSWISGILVCLTVMCRFPLVVESVSNPSSQKETPSSRGLFLCQDIATLPVNYNIIGT